MKIWSNTIAGTALGLLNNNGLLGGILGGGANTLRQHGAMHEISDLQSEIARLRSEKYADQIGKEVYGQSLTDNRQLRTETLAAINPLIDEAHKNAVNIARLEEQIKCCCEKSAIRDENLAERIATQGINLASKINETALSLNNKIDTNLATLNGHINTNFATVGGRFDTMEARNAGIFNSLNQTIACIQGKVDDITSTNVDFCKISPRPLPAAMSVPPEGTTWYPECTQPLAKQV